jgi:hypothetical protein
LKILEMHIMKLPIVIIYLLKDSIWLI